MNEREKIEYFRKNQSDYKLRGNRLYMERWRMVTFPDKYMNDVRFAEINRILGVIDEYDQKCKTLALESR